MLCCVDMDAGHRCHELSLAIASHSRVDVRDDDGRRREHGFVRLVYLPSIK